MEREAWRKYKELIKEQIKKGRLHFPRLAYKEYRDEVKTGRDIERMNTRARGRDFIIYDKDGEGYTIIYGERATHDGTKAELRAYLWENCATEIYADYSPTGRYFTTSYKVAHLHGNEWKVAEHFSLDI